MAREDAYIVEQFKKITLSHLKDVMLALPAIVPQTNEDKALFKEGLNKIDRLIRNIESCENIRELSRYIDVDRVVRDFDSESIRNLNSKIINSSRNSINELDEMVSKMRGEDD